MHLQARWGYPKNIKGIFKHFLTNTLGLYYRPTSAIGDQFRDKRVQFIAIILAHPKVVWKNSMFSDKTAYCTFIDLSICVLLKS